jgi:hypothetical protein
LVRAFPPQAFHGDIPYNTNYPPQSDNEGGSNPPTGKMIFNNTGEIMLFNNTNEEMEYNS